MNVHPTAKVSPQAELASSVEIGPYSIIDGPVKIGERVRIHSHCILTGRTEIAADCQIFSGAILGYPAQIRGQNLDSLSSLIIGKGNIIREYVTIHRASSPQQKTLVGDDNYFMAFAHIAHDCQIGNRVVLCNGSLLAGHIIVEDDVFVSGNVTVHQFCRLGKLSMIGGLARISKDVPPFMLAKGDSEIWATNSVGLKRAKIEAKIRDEIKTAFKAIYKSGLNLRQAVEIIEKDCKSNEVRYLIQFIHASRRGICGPAHSHHFLNRQLFKRRISAYRLFLKAKASLTELEDEQKRDENLSI